MSVKIIILAIFVVYFGLAYCSYVEIPVSVENKCWVKLNDERNVLFCRRDASFYWDVLFDEPVPEDGLKAYCCAHHQYFSCVRSLAKYHCKSNETGQILNSISDQESELGKLCDGSYKSGSWKCEMPIWGTVLAFMAFLAAFGLLAYILFGVMGIQG